MTTLNKLSTLEMEKVTDFLSKTEPFNEFSVGALQDFAAHLRLLHLRAEEDLFDFGDKDKSLYIVFHGRLRAFLLNMGKNDEVINEICLGEMISELTHGILPEEQIKISAVRDSVLLMCDEMDYQAFEIHHPKEALLLNKRALKDLQQQVRKKQIGEDSKSFVLMPAGSSSSQFFNNITKNIEETLANNQTTFLITKQKCDEHFGKNISSSPFSEAHESMLASWVRTLEKNYDFLIFQTDLELTGWSEYCLNQADRLVMVADSEKSSNLNSLEIFLFSRKKELLPFIDLAVVRPESAHEIKNTARWFIKRDYQNYHHVKLQSKPDLERLIRFITGQALGIVLNGGGSRGFVHVGVVKALRELNIPIDYIAGVSVGAVVGGACASMELNQIHEIAVYYSDYYKKEWTLPVLSLFTGKFNSEFFQKFWGDMRIEDLENRFFSISTNLTESKPEIHDKGPMWLAMRTSSSIPVIYPPIYDNEVNMLVDGSVANNMPVDIMRKRLAGGKILAVNCRIETKMILENRPNHPWFSGWDMLFKGLNPFKKQKIKQDTMVDVLLASLNYSTRLFEREMKMKADYVIEFDTNKYNPVDFKEVKDLIDYGYHISLEKLPHLLKLK